MYSFLRPLLFALDAERAHGVTLATLNAAHRTGVLKYLVDRPKPLPTKAFGLQFSNPVGLAAGLDKNGAYIDALAMLGFGFIEIGTITPKAQPGNPKPRMFRIAEHDAVINRLGFNNQGVEQLVRNVEASRFFRESQRRTLLGINIGKNKDTPNESAVEDYLYCLRRVYRLADYITINISSPNTDGLRDLQNEIALRMLIMKLRDAQEFLSAQHNRRVPFLVKIAPDLDQVGIDTMAKVFNDLKVDGIVATNTTIERYALVGHPLQKESGGLSGRPLYELSTSVLRRLRSRLDDSIPIIGVGGILSGADAAAKVAAGANLVQVYSGLIYRGPDLIKESIEAIRRRREGIAK